MKRKSFIFGLGLVLLFILASVSSARAEIRIMPLGDSITLGGSSGVVPDDQAFYVSYRKALWDKLEAAGYVTDFVGSQVGGSAIPDFDPDHEGHGGWRDDEILNGRKSQPNKGKLIEWLINNQPDIVLLHIGTNGVESSPDDIEAILENLDKSLQHTRMLIRNILPAMLARTRECQCSTALENAILTHPDYIPEQKKQEWDILIGKYCDQ